MLLVSAGVVCFVEVCVVIELKILASTCNYGALHDSLIRDRLICGINDSNLRKRLLRVADLDLQKCLEIYTKASVTIKSVLFSGAFANVMVS
jgi:hypothetical protein